jgi:hypothetical protein
MSATTETHCHAAELLWEEQMGETFRQAMRDATGRDCVCHQEKPCWLMDRALELLAPTVAEQSWNVKFLALCDSVGEDRKHLIFDYLARGLDDTARAEQLAALDRSAHASAPAAPPGPS